MHGTDLNIQNRLALGQEAPSDATVEGFQFLSRENERNACVQSLFSGIAFCTDRALGEQSLAQRKVQRLAYQVVILRVVEEETGHFLPQNPAEISRDSGE